MHHSPLVDFKGPHPVGVEKDRITAFADHQDEIYVDGLRGVVPRFPMTYDDLEPLAQAAMPASVRSYVAGGAGDERTQSANVTAFERWGLLPRMMVGATHTASPTAAKSASSTSCGPCSPRPT